jgi:hypothetical protein
MLTDLTPPDTVNYVVALYVINVIDIEYDVLTALIWEVIYRVSQENVLTL